MQGLTHLFLLEFKPLAFGLETTPFDPAVTSYDIHQLGAVVRPQQFPENIDNRIKLETRITAGAGSDVIQPACDRLTMKIGHCC